MGAGVGHRGLGEFFKKAVKLHVVKIRGSLNRPCAGDAGNVFMKHGLAGGAFAALFELGGKIGEEGLGRDVGEAGGEGIDEEGVAAKG